MNSDTSNYFQYPQQIIITNEKGREKWCDGILVEVKQSITYNGGIVIGNKWYQGIFVPEPKIPKGYELVSCHFGSNLNTQPPATKMLLRKI